MFISATPRSSSMVSFRVDDEMDCSLKALSSSLREHRSTLVRVAVLNLLKEARAKKPTALSQLIRNDT
jgi:predicted DNA-binding protein